jgi:menaquinol-cytochrome c reductase iron-sulfur subunit
MTDKPKNPTAEGGAPGGGPPPGNPDRRTFLSRLSIGLGGFAALLVGVPVILDIFKSMVAKEPRVWRTIGPVSKFQVGKTVVVDFENSNPKAWAGSSAQSSAYLRRDSETQFTSFTVNCSHLGCPVRWEQQADLFLCPCHGGVYYANGDVAAGPPPRPLARYPVRVRGGNVEILTTPVPIDGRVPKAS